jgi:osmoprotectant transport system permease protein
MNEGFPVRWLLVPSLVALLGLPASLHAAQVRPIAIGCKDDVEGEVLAEIMAQLLEDRGFTVERRYSLGGTKIAFTALATGAIDVYPEYSGTIEQEILHRPGTSIARMRELLRSRHNLELLELFGFSNTYALTLRRAKAEMLGLSRISDLTKHPELRLGFSNEFLKRNDGWPGLARAYGLEARPVGLEHALAYQAIHDDKLDITDAYSTDGDLKKFDLVLLEDDRHYFPSYLAAPLVRAELDDHAKRALESLRAVTTEAEMQSLNESVQNGKKVADVAAQFLRRKGLLTGRGSSSQSSAATEELETRSIDWSFLLACTATHLKLTVLSLLAGMAVAIPLGIVIYRLPAISKSVLYVAGVLQTIPSIALLAFLIPVFGIGAKPAIVALFLYALLPILRNTATALFSIDPVLRKVSVGMGLTAWQRLRYVELPLAAPTILAGIKTAAVINIGTATLAAFIGAGGLGEPIVTGLKLNDPSLILQGAIPAALLAVLTELGFELLERGLIPRHLLQKPAE